MPARYQMRLDWAVPALLLAGALACDGQSSAEQQRVTVQQATVVPVVRWQAGQAVTYAFHLRTEAKLAGAPTGELNASGRLTLRPLEARADGQWFVLGMSGVTFQAPQGRPSPDYSALRSELGAAQGAFRFKDGVLAEQWVHREASPVGANLIRTLIAALQSSSGGQAREVDSTGSYEVEVTPDAGGFAKKKVKYSQLNSVGVLRGRDARPPVPALHDAVFRYRVEAGRILGVQGREVVRNDMGGKSTLEATNELSLQTTTEPGVTLPTLEQVKQRARLWGTDEAFVGADENPRLDAARRAEFTYDAALKKLVELQRETKGDFSSGPQGAPLDEATRKLRSEQLTVFQKAFESLSAHLRASPELVERALATIRRGGPEERALLVDALGSAGSPEAQRALLAIAKSDSEDLRFRGTAYSRLARAEKPLEEVAPALLEISRHPRLAEFGLLGLGTLARRLRESGAVERANSVDELLAKELASATNPGQKRRVLLGMSNSGGPSNVEHARPFLSDEDNNLVQAAVAAVRLVPGPGADAILVTALSHTERSIRRVALDAMKAREPSQALVTAAGALAQNGKDVSDQVRAIYVLGAWRRANAEAARLLAALANSDSSEKVRGAARQQLGG